MMLPITFCSLLIVSMALLLGSTRPERLSKSLRQRLIVIRDTVDKAGFDGSGASIANQDQRAWAQRIADASNRLAVLRELSRLLLIAGGDYTLLAFLTVSAVLAVASPLLVLLAHGGSMLALGMFPGGAGAPYLLLRWRSSRRLRKFNTLMPEAIELMARSLRAGHSLVAALEMIAAQSKKPLGSEFDRVFQQQKIGVPLREALLEMTRRIPSSDLLFLVTAILIQRESGGDLTHILDRTSHVIRERARIRGEVQVHTAQGRLTGWILSALPLLLLGVLSLLDPGYVQPLFHDPFGQKLLRGAAVMIVVGAFLIRRIVDIRV